jgi:hypothetical protein
MEREVCSVIQKAIRELQEYVSNNPDGYADIVAAINSDNDDQIYLRFENKKFSKMSICAIDYQFAPKQLRRYYDDEDEMRNVPIDKIVEYLGPLIEEAWVRVE